MKSICVSGGVTILAVLGLIFTGAAAQAQTVIAGWDFENLPPPASGTSSVAPAFIADDLGTAANIATATLGNNGTFTNISADGATPGYAYTTPGDDTIGTSNPSNNALRLGIGTNSAATGTPNNNGSEIVWSASTVGFSTISSVSYTTYASSASAFQTQTFGYSTDGGATYQTLPSIAVPLQGTSKAPITGADAAGYSTETFALSTVAALAENPNDKFEIVFTGAPAYAKTAAPNNRIDNITVNGQADPASAAPEPSQYAGFGLFILALSGLALRARKSADAA